MREASVWFIISSGVHPGANSRRSNPLSVTLMTAISVTMRSTQALAGSQKGPRLIPSVSGGSPEEARSGFHFEGTQFKRIRIGDDPHVGADTEIGESDHVVQFSHNLDGIHFDPDFFLGLP